MHGTYMKRRELLAVLTATAAVAACGGGGGDGGDTPPPSSPFVFNEADIKVLDAAAATGSDSLVRIDQSNAATDSAGKTLVVYTALVDAGIIPQRIVAKAVLIGADGAIGAPVPISALDQLGDVEDVRVKFNAQGDALAVWRQGYTAGGTARRLVAALFNGQTRAWSAPAALSTTGVAAGGANVDVTQWDATFADGKPVVVWTEVETINFGQVQARTKASRLQGDTRAAQPQWGTPEVVYENDQLGYRDLEIQAGVLPDGRILLATIGAYGGPPKKSAVVLYVSGPAGQPWPGGNGAGAYDLAVSDKRIYSNLRMVTDASGRAFLTWSVQEGAVTVECARLLDVATLKWSEPTRVDVGSLTVLPKGPRVSVDASGNAMICWTQLRQVDAINFVEEFCVRRFDATKNGFDGAPKVLQGAATGVPEGGVVAFGSGGHAVLAWARLAKDQSDAYEFYAVRFDSKDKSFTEPQRVAVGPVASNATNVPLLSVSVSPTGRARLTWRDGNPQAVPAGKRLLSVSSMA